MIYPMLRSRKDLPHLDKCPVRSIRDWATSLEKAVHLVLAPWVPLPHLRHAVSTPPSAQVIICLLAATTSFFLALRTPITSDMNWQSVPRDHLWLILNNQLYSPSQKTGFKVTMWPSSPGQHKENILLLPVVGDLGVWICYSYLARLHERRHCWHRWKDEKEPGPWWPCWVPRWGLWPFPQQSCLGIKCMLGKGWVEKKGVRWSHLNLTQMSLAEVWRECWRGSK